MERHTIKITVGEEQISFETGKIAKQANGAVIVRSGDTMVFTTACASPTADPGVDFFPLRVDYQEKFSSAGKTMGGFIKREGRPTEREILISRLIDRPLRPMFPEGYFNEVQILSFVWSYDGVHVPDALAICAASAALVVSDIPLLKPVGAVRVGYINGSFVINPSVEHQKQSKLDLTLAGTEDAILMIEGYCDFLTEDQIIEAISVGHSGIKTICQALSQWSKAIGKPKKMDGLRLPPEGLLQSVESIANPLLRNALLIIEKQKREEAISAVKKAVLTALFPEGQEPKYNLLDVESVFKQVQSNAIRRIILSEDIRCDGRTHKDIRFIDIEQSLLPRAHGSSLFTRGETQAVAVCTLGGESMAQRYEDLDGEGSRRFYLQYFFPPFSVGEVGRVGAPGRREVGHGKLAERALQATIPSKDTFPYTVRLESNITESNGSSSMASVCGGCLALMDAGVPIKRPVAGIAMGLILEGTNFKILSDILGIEDALGDMDFKVTGDESGITAFQMDIKVEGITLEIMRVALAQAKEGRVHILKKMLAVCPTSKSTMSTYAPRITSIKVKPSKIGLIIGPGGKQIRQIMEETGAQIDISDDGSVSISSNTAEGADKARDKIESLVAEVEVGRSYTGKVVSIKDFGLFVEILPGKEGLCHISEFDKMRINNLNDHVKIGDPITVKVLEINQDRNQIKLSRKATLV